MRNRWHTLRIIFFLEKKKSFLPWARRATTGNFLLHWLRTTSLKGLKMRSLPDWAPQSRTVAKKSSQQFRQNIFQLEIRQKKCLFLHDLHLFSYSVELLFKLIIQLNYDVIDEDATLLRQELLATWIRELMARQVTISPTMTSTIWPNISPLSLSLSLGRFSFVFWTICCK